MSASEDIHTGPRKRQKIDVACNTCKSRKSKCDGRRPVCGPCSRRRGGRDANTCTYRPSEPKASQLDGAITLEEDDQIDPEILRHVPRSLGASTAPLNSLERTPVAQPEHSDAVSQASSARSDGLEADRDADAMGCVDDWALRKGLLGTASGASFLRQIRKAAEGNEIPDPGGFLGSRSSHVSNPLLKLRRHRIEDEEDIDHLFVLPPKKTADHLFRVYWDYSDPIFPWLDREEISQQYATLWTASKGNKAMDERVFHCTLNLMFALASSLDPTSKAETRSRLATSYYSRAKTLLSFNLLDISHFQILQALLLTAQYLQSTSMPRQCFQAVGMAVWISQDMGLHLPLATESLIDPHERELARRVWQGCIVMDKIASMTFGRPSRISQAVADQAPYPLPYEVPTRSPQTQPAKFAFFIAYCKLHQILGLVLDSFYTVQANSVTFGSPKANTDVSVKRFADLFDIETKLADWHDGLEEHLKVPSSYIDRSETLYVTRQANILHARHMYTRLLLFRPFLTQAHQPGRRGITTAGTEAGTAEVPVFDSVISQCQLLCIQSAQQMIALLFKNLPMRPEDRSRDTLPSWWYTIAYVYSACLVLIAAQMLPTTMTSFQTRVPTLADDLERGYQILQHYEGYSKSAKRCRSALKSVQRKLLGPPGGGTDPGPDLPSEQYFYQSSRNESDVSQAVSVPVFPWDEDLSWLGPDCFDWNSPSLNFTQ